MAGINESDNDESGEISAINITPFVDVVLVLLVIFIVTAPMLVKDLLEIRLPKTATADGKMTETLGIAINKNGNILVNGSLVDEAELASRAQQALKMDTDAQAIIAADIEVAYGQVVRVIDLLKKNGLNKFAVQIEQEQTTTPSSGAATQ